MYIQRLIEPKVIEAAKSFPAVVITGPRQSGKSTLLKHLLANESGSSISLEDPRLRELLAEDPVGFLEAQPKPVFLDEIQYFPEVLTAVKILIDRDRKPGHWFLTGSQQFPVMKNVSESLAGRVAVLTLPPFQLAERPNIKDLKTFLTAGAYPELVVNSGIDSRLWYSSYLQTYLERDVRNLVQVHDLRDFERFMKLIAARVAQELHMSALASEIGVSVSTIKRWVSVLEASYILYLLPPYYENLGKRVVKTPKVYFYDNGLLNYLLGFHQPEILLGSSLAGSIFENAVVSEIIKMQWGQGYKPEVYFWKSYGGIEVDMVLMQEGIPIPLEIKMSSVIKPAFCKHFELWWELTNSKSKKAFLVTNSNDTFPLGPGICHLRCDALGQRDNRLAALSS